MRIILVIVFCLCFGGLCLAEEVQSIPTEPAEISITHEEQLIIENLQLKSQIIQGQLDSFVKGLVAKYHIDPKDWSYDNVGGKFVKIKQSVKE